MWLPIESAPEGRYILAYAANRPWSDGRDDPKRVIVIKVVRENPCIVTGEKTYFDQFGPDRFSESDLTHWQPLPEPPQ